MATEMEPRPRTPDTDVPAVPPAHAPRHHGRASRVARWIAGVLATLVVVVIAAVLVLTNTDWGREQLRRRVVAALANTVHGQFRVGRVSGNLLKGITLHDVAIADSTGAPFVRLDSVRTRYGLRSFFSKKIELSGLTLWRPVIVLDRRPGEAWNWERIFPSDTTKADTSTGPGWGDWLVFRDARLVDGRITVRTPWQPDSGLMGAARDSAVRAALDTASRALVVAVPNGYQQVQDFRDIHATLPLVRLAHPDFASRRIEADSLRLVALPFRPPAAEVRQVRGAFELTSDSLWFRNVLAELPESRATLTGRYDLNTGALAVGGKAQPVSLAEVRFLIPALPEGTATSDFAVTLTDSAQGYRFDALDLRTGATTARGRVAVVVSDSAGTEPVTFDSTALTFDRLDTRLIARLVPTLDVPRHGTLGGRLAADGPLSALRLDGDVAFDDPVTGRSRVVAVGEIGTADGVVRARGLRVQLAPVQVDLARLFVEDLPVRGTLAGRATVDGSTAGRLAVTGMDLTHLDRGARSRVTGRATVALGTGDVPAPADDRPRAGPGSPAPLRDDARRRVASAGPRRAAPWFDVDVTAQPLSLVTVGRFAPAAGLRGSASGPLRATGTLGDLRVAGDLALSDGGRIAADGRLDLEGTIGYDVAVRTTVFNANAIVAKAPATSLTGRFAARGRGTEPATLTASVAADLTTSTVREQGVDALALRARAAGGLLTIDTLRAQVPGAQAQVVGTFGLARGRAGELQYRLDIDSLPAFARYLPRDTTAVPPRPGIAAQQFARARADSAARAQRIAVAVAAGDAAPPVLAPVDTPTTVRRDSLAGAIYAEGIVRGTLEDFDLRGRAGTVGLVALGNVVQRARVAYRWENARTPTGALAVAAAADSVRLSGFQLDSLDARVTFRPGAGGGLTTGDGTAIVAVYQDVGRSYDARADYALLPTGNEARFSQLRLRFDTTTWASTRPGAIRWGQPGLAVETIELTNGGTGRLFVDGRLPTTGPADLRVQVRDFQVADALGLIESDVSARGLVSLDAALTGTRAAPIIRSTATLDSATYRDTAVPAVRATMSYANTRLAADATATFEGRQVLTATAALPVNLALSGVTGPRLAEDAPVDARVRLDSLPLDLASRFTDAVADVRGAAEGTLTATGSIRRPTLAGDLRVPNGGFRVTALGVTMRDVAANVRLRGDTVVVDSVAGYTAPGRKGRIALAGGFGIKDAARPSVDLRFTADEARVLDNEQGRLTASAQIAAYGPFDGVNVSGGARVLGGVIYIPKSDSRQVLSAGDPAVFAVVDTAQLRGTGILPTQSPLLENLRMDVFVGVDRDTWVRRPGEANVEIYSDGDLRVRVDRAKQALAIDGIVNTDRGEYEFLSKRFQIRRGSATFIGLQDINPNLQITAEYEVAQAARQPLAVRIQIGGTLESPKIALESDAQPPIPQTDLLSYLAFGNPTGSLPVIGGSSLAGPSTQGTPIGATAAVARQRLAGVFLGVLVDEAESDLGRSLGADVFNITPSGELAPELARFEVSGLETILKSTQVEFGRYFNRQLFVGLQATPVFYQGTPPIPGFRVQYRFARTPGLSLESVYQPRFFLFEPTLGRQGVEQYNSLGVVLTRRWRF